jgi:glycolate oxidase subunit GlcD
VKNLSGLQSEVSGPLLTNEADLAAYSYDAALDRSRPEGVVLARSAEDVRRAVTWCAEHRVPFVARGAGTNLSGGCVPLRGGVVISLAGLNRILAIDTQEGFAIVEPGVVNLHLQQSLEKIGWFYAPDPASFKICTLGGNAAENSGGPRCLKYGVTTNHVRAIEAVMPDGTLERFSIDDAGPEIMSLLIGSEGTLGIVTKIWCRLTPLPNTVRTALVAFPELEKAMACVSAIIVSGVVPRVLEAMDRLTCESIENFKPCGLPDAEAVLLIEVEGEARVSALELSKVEQLCREHGSTSFRVAQDEEEREKLWEGRRSAYAALARLAPNVLVEDGVVPRTRLVDAVGRIRDISERNKVRAGLLFHAGDGNLHPNMIFDERDADLTRRTRHAGEEILRACVELGGSISGEHGIGIDKRNAMGWLFPPETLNLFRRIKKAVDPEGLANPDKLFPVETEGEAAPKYVARGRPLSDAANSLVARVREKANAGEELIVLGSGSKAPKDLRSGSELLTVRPLDAIKEIDTGNFTVTVEAGIRLSELHAFIEKEGVYLHLPMIPGTLGGLLATKQWSGVRDDVLAMRILLPEGDVCEVGAPVVKSVAGYDIPRLLVGSWGTLAIILEVTLRAHARRGTQPNDPPAPVRPVFSKRHSQIKEAFDPNSLLNEWVKRA